MRYVGIGVFILNTLSRYTLGRNIYFNFFRILEGQLDLVEKSQENDYSRSFDIQHIYSHIYTCLYNEIHCASTDWIAVINDTAINQRNHSFLFYVYQEPICH